MPWGKWKGQILAVSEGAIETAEAIEKTIEELGELVGFGVEIEERSVMWTAEIRYAQKGSDLVRRLSQKIRLVIESVQPKDGVGCYVAVGAQGGDVWSKGSQRGVDLFREALAKKVELEPIEADMSARDYVRWLNR